MGFGEGGGREGGQEGELERSILNHGCMFLTCCPAQEICLGIVWAESTRGSHDAGISFCHQVMRQGGLE